MMFLFNRARFRRLLRTMPRCERRLLINALDAAWSTLVPGAAQEISQPRTAAPHLAGGAAITWAAGLGCCGGSRARRRRPAQARPASVRGTERGARTRGAEGNLGRPTAAAAGRASVEGWPLSSRVSLSLSPSLLPSLPPSLPLSRSRFHASAPGEG